MNLFSAPMESVTFDDIASTLGLNLPEDRRIPEGVKIDYKDLDVPNDLGDTVAAFSNTSGGLIFIGIQSDKVKGNVPVAWPGVPNAKDLETRISSKVLSTVRPKPPFEVRTVRVSEANAIVVVRVQDGPYPPYEYEQGNTVRIPMRINDLTRQSNVRDIEQLFNKRNSGAPVSEQAILQYVNAPGFDCTNANGIPEYEFHRVVVVPRKRTQIRLDAGYETRFAGKIQQHFGSEYDPATSDRRGDYLQLQSKRTVVPYWHRLWRVWRDGAVGFTSSLEGEFPNGKPIGDLARDLLLTCRLASEILAEGEVVGEVTVGQLIRSTTTNLLAAFPELSPRGEYFATTAISIPKLKENPIDRTFSFNALDLSDLHEPDEQIAEILMYNLRELRKITVDYKGFIECIRRTHGDKI